MLRLILFVLIGFFSLTTSAQNDMGWNWGDRESDHPDYSPAMEKNTYYLYHNGPVFRFDADDKYSVGGNYDESSFRENVGYHYLYLYQFANDEEQESSLEELYFPD